MSLRLEWNEQEDHVSCTCRSRILSPWSPLCFSSERGVSFFSWLPSPSSFCSCRDTTHFIETFPPVDTHSTPFGRRDRTTVLLLLSTLTLIRTGEAIAAHRNHPPTSVAAVAVTPVPVMSVFLWATQYQRYHKWVRWRHSPQHRPLDSSSARQPIQWSSVIQTVVRMIDLMLPAPSVCSVTSQTVSRWRVVRITPQWHAATWTQRASVALFSLERPANRCPVDLQRAPYTDTFIQRPAPNLLEMAVWTVFPIVLQWALTTLPQTVSPSTTTPTTTTVQCRAPIKPLTLLRLVQRRR